MNRVGSFFAALVLLSWTSGANATLINWTVALAGANEVPPVATSATGSGVGTLDDVTGLLSWNVVVDGLSGPPLAAHFHLGEPGMNGAVVVNMGSPVSLAPATYVGTDTISSTQVAQFLAGSWYVNVHTAAVPSGEVRGQVAVPEPSTLGLLGAGLLGLRFIRRRRAA